MPLPITPIPTDTVHRDDPGDLSTDRSGGSATYLVVHAAVWSLLPALAVPGAATERHLLTSLPPQARVEAAGELVVVLAHLVIEEGNDPRWSGAFHPRAFAWALEDGLLRQDQMPLCLQWLDHLRHRDVLGMLGGLEPELLEPTADDLHALLALTFVALSALPDPGAALTRCLG